MVINKLTINPSKFSILFLQPKLKCIPLTLEINFDNCIVQSSDCINYLGIKLDQYLNFKSHTENIINKLSKNVGILWKLRKFLPRKTLICLYYAFIQSHLLYGLVVWGSTISGKSFNQLQLLQNNSIRAIIGLPKYEHISSYYFKLEILKIKDLNKFEIAKLMYLYHSSCLPCSFDNYFVKPSNIHKYTTRSNDNFNYYIPKYRLARLQKSFKYTGVKIWNDLGTEIKLLSFTKFKKTYKNQLLSKY